MKTNEEKRKDTINLTSSSKIMIIRDYIQTAIHWINNRDTTKDKRH